MRTFRIIALIVLATALTTGVPAWAQSNNVRIAPQSSNVRADGSRKIGEQKQPTLDEAAASQIAKKKIDNKGVGQQLIPLQKPH